MTAVVYPDSQAKSSESVNAKQMINQKVHRMTFEMDKELHSKLKVAAAQDGSYIKDILLQATEEWLKKRGYL